MKLICIMAPDDFELSLVHNSTINMQVLEGLPDVDIEIHLNQATPELPYVVFRRTAPLRFDGDQKSPNQIQGSPPPYGSYAPLG